jgi:hypothetical protein
MDPISYSVFLHYPRRLARMKLSNLLHAFVSHEENKKIEYCSWGCIHNISFSSKLMNGPDQLGALPA